MRTATFQHVSLAFYTVATHSVNTSFVNIRESASWPSRACKLVNFAWTWPVWTSPLLSSPLRLRCNDLSRSEPLQRNRLSLPASHDFTRVDIVSLLSELEQSSKLSSKRFFFFLIIFQRRSNSLKIDFNVRASGLKTQRYPCR